MSPQLGDTHLRTGRHPAAIATAQAAIHALESLLGGPQPTIRASRKHLVESYIATGDSAISARGRGDLAGMK